MIEEVTGYVITGANLCELEVLQNFKPRLHAGPQPGIDHSRTLARG